MPFSDNWNDVYPRGEFQQEGPGGTYCNPVSGYWGRSRTSNTRIVDRENKKTADVGGCAPFKSMNYMNGNGDSCVEVQRKLNHFFLSTPSGATGRPAGTLITDGVFGAKSEAMAIWFQRTVGGLTADGLIGLSTWSRLRNW